MAAGGKLESGELRKKTRDAPAVSSREVLIFNELVKTRVLTFKRHCARKFSTPLTETLFLINSGLIKVDPALSLLLGMRRRIKKEKKIQKNKT